MNVVNQHKVVSIQRNDLPFYKQVKITYISHFMCKYVLLIAWKSDKCLWLVWNTAIHLVHSCKYHWIRCGLCLPILKRTGCVMENMCSPPENLQHNSSKTNQCIAVNMFYVISYIYIFFIWTIMLDLPCYNSTFFAGEKYGLTRWTTGGFHIMYVTAQFIMWRFPLQMKISYDRVYLLSFHDLSPTQILIIIDVWRNDQFVL